MGESTQPGTPKLYRVAIYRPISDGGVKGLEAPVGDGRFLLLKMDGALSPDSAARRRLEEIRKILPPDWKLKITEVPFTITYGTPAVVGTCPRAGCQNYSVQMKGEFFCGLCGEPLQLTWEGTTEE
jgi:hypothetical protein